MTANRNGKTGSRNPANKPTSVTAWKKASASAPPVLLPSGNYMRIRKVGMQVLLKTGLMPNNLMSLVKKSLDKAEGKKNDDVVSTEDAQELLMDPEKLQGLMDFLDRMTIFVAQEPSVMPDPGEGVERDDSLLYVDEVDFEDKMFIFQVVCGGTTDVESFRAEHSAAMADIRGRENLELPSE